MSVFKECSASFSFVLVFQQTALLYCFGSLSPLSSLQAAVSGVHDVFAHNMLLKNVCNVYRMHTNAQMQMALFLQHATQAHTSTKEPCLEGAGARMHERTDTKAHASCIVKERLLF